MRRPPIACQRAVQSLQSPSAQHIWISDDQLSIAVNRFFRTTCPHQKRHGSNVPGPLEARKRAAKRRMTASAGFYPQDNFPPSFSISALFGFRRNPQPSWQYQPPSSRKEVTPIDKFLRPPDVTSAYSSPIPSLEPASPAYDHDPANPQEDSHKLAQTTTVDVESLQKGSNADIELGGEVQVATVTRVKPTTMSVDIKACFKLFKSRIANASSWDRERIILSAFETSCPPCANAWEYNVMVIKHLLVRKRDPTPLLALADDQPSSFTLPPTYTPAYQRLLKSTDIISVAFPKSTQQLHALYMRLAQAAVDANSSANAAQDDCLITLCRQLWKSSHALDSGLRNSSVRLLCTVASKVHNHHTGAALRLVLAQTYSKDGPKCALMDLVSQASTSRSQYIAAADVLRCMPRNLLLDVIPVYTLHFFRVRQKTRAAESIHKERWNTWLSLICHADRDTALGLVYLDAAIDPLVKAVFYSDPREAVAKRFPNCTKVGYLLHALLYKFTEQAGAYAASKTVVAQAIDSTLLFISTQNKILQPEAVVAGVISSLKKASLPYRRFADAIVASLAQHGNLSALANFMTRLDDHRLNLGETSVVQAVVQAVVQQKAVASQQHTASLTNTELQHNALTLQNCQTIASILSKIASAKAVQCRMELPTALTTLQAQRQVQHILDRADAARALPLAFRDISVGMTLEDRVVLIHQLAHQYSLDRTRTHREVWRAIYYLYRHLDEHCMSIGPLFSRAVVRVSIIRPLSENRFVSARRLIWVCHLVARVEGEAVARKIEGDFWQWRGNLIKHAKHVHDSIGADRREKAHVGTMRRLGII